MRAFLYLFLILSLSLGATAGNSDKQKASVRSISGKVTNTQGEEISGVKITIAETGENVFADMDGKFNLQVKNDKAYTLNVESIGYAPKTISSKDLSLFSEISLSEL